MMELTCFITVMIMALNLLSNVAFTAAKVAMVTEFSGDVKFKRSNSEKDMKPFKKMILKESDTITTGTVW